MKHDALLQLVTEAGTKIDDAHDGRVGQPITLLFGGMLVSGTIISVKEYMHSHVILDAIDAGELKGFASPPGGFEHTEFIHLKRAEFLVPGHPPVSTPAGIFWRGRLDRVDGFWVGGLQVTQTQREQRP